MSADAFNDDPRPWTVTASKYLHRRPWLTVRHDVVQLPTGATLDEYYVFEFPTWVNVVAVTEDQRIILERQYRHGIQRVNWELPAGVSDPSDPDPQTSARRELLEETGYGEGQWSHLMTISPNPGTHDNLTYCYLARGVRKIAEPKTEPGEDIRVHFVSMDRARELALGEGFMQALHVAPLLKFLLMEENGKSKR